MTKHHIYDVCKSLFVNDRKICILTMSLIRDECDSKMFKHSMPTDLHLHFVYHSFV